MRLGLLSCGKRKLPVPAPAWLLYSVSPRFSQQFQFLQAYCDRVAILSARYGLVLPERVLLPYNAQLPRGMAYERWCVEVARQIRALHPTRLVSLLPQSYARALPATHVPVEQPAAGNMMQLAASLGQQGKLKRGEIQECWPLTWVLSWVVDQGEVLLTDLAAEIRRRGYREVTVTSQLGRSCRCPLFVKQDAVLRARYPRTPCSP